jgi:hypothetical protein
MGACYCLRNPVKRLQICIVVVMYRQKLHLFGFIGPKYSLLNWLHEANSSFYANDIV